MKKIIVTGASGGIGSAVVEALKEDCLVLAQYNKNPSGVPSGQNVIKIHGDFSTKEGVELFATEVKKFGAPYGLVNCSGVARSGLLTDFSDEGIEELLFIDLVAPVLLTKKILPSFISEKRGSIVNVSSVWGVCGASCETPYSAAKGGIVAFTKALAKELGPSGIRVNCVAPGFIDTAMNANYSEEDRRLFCEELSLGRIGRPEEVAGAIKFLLSDESSYISGQILSVDGGYR